VFLFKLLPLSIQSNQLTPAEPEYKEDPSIVFNLPTQLIGEQIKSLQTMYQLLNLVYYFYNHIIYQYILYNLEKWYFVLFEA